MPKISALPPAGTLADDDETPFVDDSAATTKKFTLSGLKTWLQSLTAWISSVMLVEAFFRGRLQANTTNTAPTGLTVQHGWGFATGTGGTSATKAITFPAAFASEPVVVITPLGFKTTAGTPAAMSELAVDGANNNPVVNAIAISATGFTARVARNDSTSVISSGHFAGYTWIAIGPLA